MRRIKTGSNVFDTAVQRIYEQYALGHTLVVSLSGGKDSGTCLELCIIAAEMAGCLPVNACIQDEEIAYPGTYEYVERMAQRPEVNLLWFDCRQPMVNVFDRANPYFWVFDEQLSPEDWVRKPPSFAVRNPEINIESIVHPRWFNVEPGKAIIDVVGLRAVESAKRMLGVVSSGGALTGAGAKRGGIPFHKLRPIYDWSDGDVWRAHKENGWDYNRAYDVMLRMGIKTKMMRVGPPTLNVHSAENLMMASKAWPRWFDRVCDRLRGVRQAAQFKNVVLFPKRRSDETWKDTFYRTCIEGAPADWIRERAVLLEQHFIEKHARHSTEPFPMTKPCPECGGGFTACYKRMAEIAFNGDPFSLKLGVVNKTKFPYMQPEFFRAGAGTWGGSPSW